MFRAIASRKQHFSGLINKMADAASQLIGQTAMLTQIIASIAGVQRGSPERVGRHTSLKYTTQAPGEWEVLRGKFGIETLSDFLNHVCNCRDGEARLIDGRYGEACFWRPLDESVIDICSPSLRRYQFASNERTRAWLRFRDEDPARRDQLLGLTDVRWTLGEEGWRTTHIRREVGASGAAAFFSQGLPGALP